MSTANEKLMIRYFEEVWNHGKLEVLDEIIAPHYINHTPKHDPHLCRIQAL